MTMTTGKASKKASTPKTDKTSNKPVGRKSKTPIKRGDDTDNEGAVQNAIAEHDSGGSVRCTRSPGMRARAKSIMRSEVYQELRKSKLAVQLLYEEGQRELKSIRLALKEETEKLVSITKICGDQKEELQETRKKVDELLKLTK